MLALAQEWEQHRQPLVDALLAKEEILNKVRTDVVVLLKGEAGAISVSNDRHLLEYSPHHRFCYLIVYFLFCAASRERSSDGGGG